MMYSSLEEIKIGNYYKCSTHHICLFETKLLVYAANFTGWLCTVILEDPGMSWVVVNRLAGALSRRFNTTVRIVDINDLFLILEQEEEFIKILHQDKIGWITLQNKVILDEVCS